jgi:O-antigen/teichoic acid export membrane protein
MRRAISWSLVSQMVMAFLQFGSGVIMARLLTPYETGIFGAATALMALLSAFQAFGLINFIVAEKALDANILRSTCTVNTILACLLSIATYVSGFSAGSLFHEAGIGTVLQLIAVIPLCSAIEFRPSAMIQREKRFELISAINVTKTVFTVFPTVFLGWAGFKYFSLAWGSILGAAVSAALYFYYGRSHVDLRFRIKEWRVVSAFGTRMLLINGVNSISLRCSELFLSRILGLEALGIFYRASNLYAVIWSNLHLVFGRVVFSHLAEIKRETSNLRGVYLAINANMTAIMWPLFFGLAVLSGPAINILYGAKWAAAALPLSLLSIAAVLQVSITMTWEVFVVSGNTATQTRIEIIRTFIGFVIFAAGCFVNVATAAGARILDAIISNFLYRSHLERMTDTRIGDFLPIYAKGLIVSLAAIFPALILMTLFHWAPSAPPMLVASSVVAGVVLWLVALRALRHPFMGELTAIGGKLLALAGRSTA